MMIKTQVSYIVISQEQSGQRLDNYLIREFKGMPRQHIYRIIRKGEVRINSKRCKPSYKLKTKDELRIPPIYQNQSDLPKSKPPETLFAELPQSVLYTDDDLIILNKKPGLASHGGSNISWGLIEAARLVFNNANLNLVHRLDRETSGCIILAKNRPALVQLHQQLRTNKINKYYHCITAGIWPAELKTSSMPLMIKTPKSGERVTAIDKAGKKSLTEFEVIKHMNTTTLIQARPITGRMHQIRVHCAEMGYPIIGDNKYAKKQKSKHLYLHAYRLVFEHPNTKKQLAINAPYPRHFATAMEGY